jgi:hypothetical protein
MGKINLYCWLVALAIIVCGAFYCKTITQQLGAVKTELKTCQKELKGAQDAEISSSKLIKELRQKALADKPAVDCYNSPMPDFIVNELSKLK